jgi:hypothetical protein
MAAHSGSEPIVLAHRAEPARFPFTEFGANEVGEAGAAPVPPAWLRRGARASLLN